MKINEKELLIALNKRAFWLTKGNWALSDDLVGGALLYRATNPNKFKNQNFINTIKLLTNKMKWLKIDYHRKNKKIEPLVDLKGKEIDIADTQNIEEEIDKKLKATKIINKMDEICRDMLLVMYRYTNDEIASRLNIKLGTVLSRKHNCMQKLIRNLAEW